MAGTLRVPLQVHEAHFAHEAPAHRILQPQYLDYPHAEGFVDPVRSARERLASLPSQSVDKILGANARKFYRIA
jgi:predicted TIM-barrel fold metal-dependent hydrolase